MHSSIIAYIFDSSVPSPSQSIAGSTVYPVTCQLPLVNNSVLVFDLLSFLHAGKIKAKQQAKISTFSMVLNFIHWINTCRVRRLPGELIMIGLFPESTQQK